MRILVISDSHGSKHNFFDAIKREPTAEVVYFLGDGFREYEEAVKEFSPQKMFIGVAGNCDLACDLPVKDTRTINGVKIYATHGYMEKVKFGLMNLEYSAMQEECSLAIFGHTHDPHYSYCDGLHMFNPGSIRNDTYGVIDITEKGIICFHKNLYSY